MSEEQRQHFARQYIRYRNELKQSMTRLSGICEGLIGDHVLTDDEIRFLHDWIAQNDAVAYEFPGSLINRRVLEVLHDGIVTEEERAYLVKTLHQLIGTADVPEAQSKQLDLELDSPSEVVFGGSLFCLTGEFVYGPKPLCERAIVQRGGLVNPAVTKKLRYLVIGGLGSDEWAHGSYGTKIQKALAYKGRGLQIAVIKEECWARSLG